MPCTAISRRRMLRHGAALRIAACGHVADRDRSRVDFDTLKTVVLNDFLAPAVVVVPLDAALPELLAHQLHCARNVAASVL